MAGDEYREIFGTEKWIRGQEAHRALKEAKPDAKERQNYPWYFEIRPRADPPDINYHDLLERYQWQMNTLMENESIHFTEKCLRNQDQEVELERDILYVYKQ